LKVVIATSAAIIASQAMISGSFTLISEAMRLNLCEKQINYPSEAKGQLFIWSINGLLFVGCMIVILYFQESSRMEAAYGACHHCYDVDDDHSFFANYGTTV